MRGVSHPLLLRYAVKRPPVVYGVDIPALRDAECVAVIEAHRTMSDEERSRWAAEFNTRNAVDPEGLRRVVDYHDRMAYGPKAPK